MVGRPTYPSVPPIDGNVPVSLSWESKQARTLVWYGKKKIMRKSFQFDEHDELTAETVEAQVRGHHMFAEVLEAHSPTDQSVGESSAAAASDAATLEASFRQEEARQAGEISEKYIMYEDRPSTRSDAERRAPATCREPCDRWLATVMSFMNGGGDAITGLSRGSRCHRRLRPHTRTLACLSGGSCTLVRLLASWLHLPCLARVCAPDTQTHSLAYFWGHGRDGLCQNYTYHILPGHTRTPESLYFHYLGAWSMDRTFLRTHHTAHTHVHHTFATLRTTLPKARPAEPTPSQPQKHTVLSARVS